MDGGGKKEEGEKGQGAEERGVGMWFRPLTLVCFFVKCLFAQKNESASPQILDKF